MTITEESQEKFELNELECESMVLDELRSGRSLDVLVAKHVMRFDTRWVEDHSATAQPTPEVLNPPTRPCGATNMQSWWPCLHYSREWMAMEQVVKEVLERFGQYELQIRMLQGRTLARFRPVGAVEGHADVQAQATTAPLAICIAALKLVKEQG